jgi:hypothetical protein
MDARKQQADQVHDVLPLHASLVANVGLHLLELRSNLRSNGVDQRSWFVRGQNAVCFSVSAFGASAVMIANMKAKQIVASYLILQAVGTEAWWSLQLLVPNSIRRELLAIPGIRQTLASEAPFDESSVRTP